MPDGMDTESIQNMRSESAMVKRKTITLDDDVYRAIQRYRAKRILEGENMSFSRAVNELIIKAVVEDGGNA